MRGAKKGDRKQGEKESRHGSGGFYSFIDCLERSGRRSRTVYLSRKRLSQLDHDTTGSTVTFETSKSKPKATCMGLSGRRRHGRMGVRMGKTPTCTHLSFPFRSLPFPLPVIKLDSPQRIQHTLFHKFFRLVSHTYIRRVSQRSSF